MNQLAELEDVKEWWNDVTEGPLGWIIYLALGVLLAIVLNAGLSSALSTDYPVVTVESDSMKPVLYPGDIVFVSGSQDYSPGDIIVFDGWKPTPIIHRIVLKSRRTEETFDIQTWEDFDDIRESDMRGYHEDVDVENMYITKGDNNPVCDQCQGTGEIVLDQHIHGKKILRIPYLGWIKLGSLRFAELLTA